MTQEQPPSETATACHASVQTETAAPAANLPPSDKGKLLLLLAFMVIWYGSGLAITGFRSGRSPLYLVFNSMFAHLIHGRFDVDPNIVGLEGFGHNGHVYAYWGIWCALLRFPLWIIGRLDWNVTTWSCLVAVCIATLAKCRAVFLLRRYAPYNKTAKAATEIMLIYFLLGGSATGYLRASVFQEVVFWAAAFGAIFVYLAIKGLISEQFTSGTLSGMALCAGLALLTRVSTGIGLVCALGLLLLVLVLRKRIAAAPNRRVALQWIRLLADRRVLIPLGIVSAFVAITGLINYFRWGNPLTFADYRFYLGNVDWPDRIQREATYGNFNFRRIPFALMYYFFPAWTHRLSDGHYLFESTQLRLFDDVELPPCTFLLTDLIAFCFIAFLAIALVKRRQCFVPSIAQISAIAAGLAAPCLLMLTAISDTYRYRMEFYPEFDFLALLGLYTVLIDKGVQSKFERWRVWVIVALVLCIIASHCGLLLYDISPFGPGIDRLRRGFI